MNCCLLRHRNELESRGLRFSAEGFKMLIRHHSSNVYLLV